MDWSAALTLKTSRPGGGFVNYGSFSRTNSKMGISIPPSIPEHQCVDQFTSPKKLHQNDRNSSLLCEGKDYLRPPASAAGEHSSLVIDRTTKSTTKIPDSIRNQEDQSTNYWVQERERLRLKREQNVHTTKRRPSLIQEKASNSIYAIKSSLWTSRKTTVLMCSVPFVLVLLFILVFFFFPESAPGLVLAAGSAQLRASGTENALSIAATATAAERTLRIHPLEP
jgi:hypothetical protein